jgi:hypothetical protein
MKLTEVVTKKIFEKEVSHESYRPIHLTTGGVGGEAAALQLSRLLHRSHLTLLRLLFLGIAPPQELLQHL